MKARRRKRRLWRGKPRKPGLEGLDRITEEEIGKTAHRGHARVVKVGGKKQLRCDKCRSTRTTLGSARVLLCGPCVARSWPAGKGREMAAWARRVRAEADPLPEDHRPHAPRWDREGFWVCYNCGVG